MKNNERFWAVTVRHPSGEREVLVKTGNTKKEATKKVGYAFVEKAEEIVELEALKELKRLLG